MSLSSSISSALNGIRTSQGAIDVVSQNVSNVNTEGYSRKSYSQKTLVLSNGVLSGAVSNLDLRQVDMKIRAELRTESGVLQKNTVEAYYLDIIQSSMGEPSSAYSVSNRINAIQSAFESLGVDSDKLNSQSTAVTALDTALTQIRNLSDQIQTLRREIDQEISSLCKEATTILTELDKLNDDIVRTDTMNGQSADNYKDQRDLLISRLAEIMDIQTYDRSSGETVIMTGGGKPLLDRDGVVLSHNAAASTGSLISYSAGSIAGIYAGRFDITNELSSGEMSGLVKLRDVELTDLQAQLDEMAFHLTEQLNSVHNRGTCYPTTVYELNGTRSFIDGDKQTIALRDGDVKIALFDEGGNEAYVVSLVHDLNFESGTINEMTDAIQKWLTDSVTGPKLPSASIGLTSEGKLKIDLGTSDYSIAIRDEISTIRGSEPGDITIDFDANADGEVDRTFKGFSSFFGLDNLIISSKAESVYESESFPLASLMGIRGKTTWYFSDTENGLNFGSIDITAGDTMKTIATKINETLLDESGNHIVKAEVVKDGSGYRLRLSNINGNQMEITETLNTSNGMTSGSVFARLGMSLSHAGYASELNVRSDILEKPNRLNTGKVQYSTSIGSYFISTTDNALANDFAGIFTQPISFSAAGSFTKVKTTLENYAASIVSGLATTLNSTNSTVSYQNELVTTLDKKEQDVSGVDLDEELAMMLLYQRAYSAAAKALTTSLDMLELLNNIVK